MAKWIVYIAFVLGISTAVKVLYEQCGPTTSKEEYLQMRNGFLQQESFERVGGKLVLTAKERLVNDRLLELKNHEISYYRQNKDGKGFPPSVHFFQAKADIEHSEVYRIIKKMPKGAALHLHEMAMADIDWVIRHFTYRPDCYICVLNTGIKLEFHNDPPFDPKCSWTKVNELREQVEDICEFDARLRENITMMTSDKNVFASQGDIWDHFEGCFQALTGVFFSEIGFAEYVRHGLEEMYEDNVQYVELRSVYSNVTRLDGSSYPETWILEQYRDISDAMQKSHPDFMGVKIIISELRRRTPEAAAAKMDEIYSWTEQYPRLIVGYDMVSHEDEGFPLVQYAESLLNVRDRRQLPFMFHSGETNWIGTAVDNNLVDAVLLNTTRIGHGYAIAHHPKVLQAVYRNKIAIEINPIANQVGDLKLCAKFEIPIIDLQPKSKISLAMALQGRSANG